MTNTNLAVSNHKRKPSATRPSASGFVGVYPAADGRWLAQVMLAIGKRKHVPGLYNTPAEAHAARVAFIELHGTAAPQPKAATVTTAEAL
ncbi:hypothetical protein [Pararobbsia alpina]|uniref:AP2/ERF domain-containing protein n=1 Tax=Pararobbsia alpina TaxID=621374 RepID=A0A6S7B029_9BURK|nr:hypothetical protein [Pararobbsia alpina]CAB3783295.1 hypothetical protein LMG28138_01611 [Pararobbsia alpina]